MKLINKIKDILEVLFLIVIFFTTFFTMPFLLNAVDKDPMVGLNYLCLIIIMIYIMKKRIKNRGF